MRVWKVNEFDWVAGPSLLTALRSACKERGCAVWEMLDREYFLEVKASDWPGINVYDPDDPDNLDLNLAAVAANQKAPGIIMSSEF